MLSFSISSTTSSFLSDISIPSSCPSNANLARYVGGSGCLGGGGGGALTRGGAGGGGFSFPTEADGDITGGCRMVDADAPGRGCVGFGLDVACTFLLGPPAFRSFPCVIGRMAPGFLFAGGRDRLPGGSPDGTWTV